MGCEYQYQLTERALQDIRETVGYLRNDLQNEKAAGKWMDAVEKSIAQLCVFPESGSVVFEEYLPGRNVRRTVIGNFILYYQILQEQKIIRVLRIVYGRRNQENIVQGFNS